MLVTGTGYRNTGFFIEKMAGVDDVNGKLVVPAQKMAEFDLEGKLVVPAHPLLIEKVKSDLST